jgi:putative membrane protein
MGSAPPPPEFAAQRGGACIGEEGPLVILRWLANAIGLVVVAAILPGIQLHGAWAVVVAALVLGIVNAIIRPVLLLISLPLNLVTLGLFTFVVNALMLELTAAVVPGFQVHGFLTAIVASLLLAVISSIVTHLARA